MQNLTIALFIIPGFLFVNSIRSIQKFKINSNWAYLLPLVIWSFVFFLSAKSLTMYVARIIDWLISVSIYNKGDDFITELYKLLGQLVVISTSSDRYYIGFLRDIPTDSDDEFRIISIAPVWSGRRDLKKPSCVVYDTNYLKNINGIESLIEMLIPFSELKSIAQFDEELNDHFIKIGKSRFTPGKF